MDKYYIIALAPESSSGDKVGPDKVVGSFKTEEEALSFGADGYSWPLAIVEVKRINSRTWREVL